MNLEDLMAVWRTQDAAPLHDVNKTLLHLALRQEEAKLQKARRVERWMVYVFGTGVVAGMAIFLWMMISFRHRPDKIVTGWDYALPIVGAAAALLAGGAIYKGHRAQARREQGFGESLREQLKRRIAQLDYAATRARRTSILVIVLLGGISPAAIIFLGMRVNDKSISDDGYLTVTSLLMCVWSVVLGVWTLRRQARELLPRKRRLEALLKELDSQ
jgi:amino acid transporter